MQWILNLLLTSAVVRVEVTCEGQRRNKTQGAHPHSFLTLSIECGLWTILIHPNYLVHHQKEWRTSMKQNWYSVCSMLNFYPEVEIQVVEQCLKPFVNWDLSKMESCQLKIHVSVSYYTCSRQLINKPFQIFSVTLWWMSQ